MPFFFARKNLDQLIKILHQSGCRVIGPRVETGQGGLVFREISSAAELPRGVRDVQSPGRYRLEQAESERCFMWANTAGAIKPYVFAPREKLWKVERKDGQLRFENLLHEPSRTAIIGVRACDLAALHIQDAHFLKDDGTDPYYRARRESLLLIAVNCSHAAQTCFCASTGDGPAVTTGYDILLDELDEGYLLQVGTSAGQNIAGRLSLAQASAGQVEVARRQTEECAAQQRRMPSAGALQRLGRKVESPVWSSVAERCLACGNCTAVCPTCFCHREFDVPALDGNSAEHWRDADSCFNADHSYIAGQVMHPHTRERFRQWMMHKLFYWIGQYGRTGCTGCGRCITWCPAGIDFLAEAHRVLEREDGV